MQRFWLYVSIVAATTIPSALTAQADKPVTVQLQPVGNTGISGTAVLTAKQRETDFALTLTAADSTRQRQELDVWLRAGTCENPGKQIADIGDVYANGTTEHEDEDVVLADLLKTTHILEVRLEDRDEVVACGAIPQGS